MVRSESRPRPLGPEKLVHLLRSVLRREGRHVGELERRLVSLLKYGIHPQESYSGEERCGGVTGDFLFCGPRLGGYLLDQNYTCFSCDSAVEEERGDKESCEEEDIFGEENWFVGAIIG